MAKTDVVLNPFVLFNLELSDQDPNLDLGDSNTLLYDLGWDPNRRTVKDVKARYKKLRTVQHGLYTAPAEKRILEKVISPLRQAMASYVLSNYLSTIALCGMAAEMLAILLYDILLTHRDRLSRDDDERLISFKQFQRSGQEKRVAHLVCLNAVNPNMSEPFETIMRIRRKYLHFYLEPVTKLESDAFEVYRCAVLLADRIIMQQVEEGQLKFHPLLLEYLKSKGTTRD